jgi:glycosyltransferase involved in cell wall biosynthesis
MSDRGAADARVSVIVPTYNRCSALRRMLQKLEQQSLPPTMFEVVVGVDGSTDSTVEMLESVSAPYSLRWVAGAHGGRAAACNSALRLAEGELVVIFDDDMEPAPTCLDAHRREHAEHPRRCVMGASPIVFDANAPPHVRYVATKFAEHLERLAQPSHRFQLRDFYSGNVSLAREELLAVGFFDERFRTYGNEDLELAHRLVSNRVALAFSPEALAVQRYDKSLGQLAADELSKGRTAVMFAELRPDARAGMRLAALEAQPVHRRALRRVLLWATRAIPKFPSLVLHALRIAGRLAPTRVQRAYPFAFDYLYMLGAERQRRARSLSHARPGTG